MTKQLKVSLLLFAFLSVVSFFYFVLPDKAGVSVPIFTLIQFVCFFKLLPKKKPLWLFLPIFLLSLNSFTSGNEMWRVSNFFVIIVLYSIMILAATDRFPVWELSNQYIINTVAQVFRPLMFFMKPFQWMTEIQQDKKQITKRIIIAIAISIPCLLFLLGMLSMADEIFSHSVHQVLKNMFEAMNFILILKVLYSILAGLYLFGLIYSAYYKPTEPEEEEVEEVQKKEGDLLILNILLFSILTIYTLFVLIQFRYLFAGSEHLPFGLTYTQYARKGFFELLFLSGLNIFLILLTVRLTKEKQGFWAKVIKALCSYLCAVTIILLTSSFYRMWLYSTDDGFTRLRLLVYGFLIFEAIGLLFTFFYIAKPKFNIVSIYLLIALTYYVIINLVPIDAMIAKNQIDRYFTLQHEQVGPIEAKINEYRSSSLERGGIDYVMTLSTDAAPQIATLLANEKTDEKTKEQAYRYFKDNEAFWKKYPQRWQRFNWSVYQSRVLGQKYLESK